MNLLKLKENDSFTLFDKNWVIKEIGIYDWSMDNSSTEYTIVCEDLTAYVEIEYHKSEYECVYSEDIDVDQQSLLEAIDKKSIHLDDQVYVLEETYQGNYKNLTTFSSREQLECFIFYADNDTQITIEKWSDGTYQAFIGEEFKSKKIKNIKQK